MELSLVVSLEKIFRNANQPGDVPTVFSGEVARGKAVTPLGF